MYLCNFNRNNARLEYSIAWKIPLVDCSGYLNSVYLRDEYYTDQVEETILMFL